MLQVVVFCADLIMMPPSKSTHKPKTSIMISLRPILPALLAASLPGLFQPASAATLPTHFAETEIVTGLDPTSLAIAPDGRLFVCEKNGTIRIVKDDAMLEEPFVRLSSVQNYNEQGLQSIAFDPDFENNGYVYVYYTVQTDQYTGRNRVSRLTADGDVAVPGSEVILLEATYPGGGDRPTDRHLSALHNGGALHFRDGLLYVAVGDDQNGENAQDLSNPFGKILRVNPDPENLIPADNPFVDNGDADPRIWAYGLRNPFTFAFDANTGRMFINDVGEYSWEEINEGVAGANFGWPRTEGETDNPDFTGPFYAYPHQDKPDDDSSNSFYDYPHTIGCAVTGGAFYSPPAAAPFPAEYQGRYFFSDYCHGEIITIDPNDPMDVQIFATGIDRCIDIDVAPDGVLYYIARGSTGAGDGSDDDNTESNNGSIYRIDYTGSDAPTIASQPQDTTVPAGENATFTVDVSGSDPEFQWLRDGVELEDGETVSGAETASLALGPVTPEDHGAEFTCVITNASGSVTSAAATLSVLEGGRPTAVILTPEEGTLYSGGTTLSFSGTGSDPEDGDSLPASAFTWWIDFHHDTHHHPGMESTSGITEGSIPITHEGHETSANVWYRIYLTVTDSDGLSHTVTREVYPLTADLTFTTVPEGLEIDLDDRPTIAPVTVEAVAGMYRDVAVSKELQLLEGVAYRFAGWSQGGDAAQTIITPEEDTTFTATFTASPIDSWKVEQFGGIAEAESPEAADLGDWDGDGTVNLLEYALQTNPTDPEDGVETEVGQVNIDGNLYLTLSFTRPSPPRDGVEYLIETSDAPGSDNWTAAVMLDGYPSDNGDGTETVTARSAEPVTGDQARFMRLRVIRRQGT